MPQLKSFVSTDRFLAEIKSPQLRAGYVLAGDEAFLYQRCRQGILAALAPADQRDFCLHDLDLADTSIFEALDLAQTPSLMVPFPGHLCPQPESPVRPRQQEGRIRRDRRLFPSGQPRRRPHLLSPTTFPFPLTLRRMDLQDKERFERIRETLGEWCGIVELARVEEGDAARWLQETAPARGVTIDPDASRELVDALGADMMLVSSEFEKLALYAQGKQLKLVQPEILSQNFTAIPLPRDHAGRC